MQNHTLLIGSAAIAVSGLTVAAEIEPLIELLDYGVVATATYTGEGTQFGMPFCAFNQSLGLAFDGSFTDQQDVFNFDDQDFVSAALDCSDPSEAGGMADISGLVEIRRPPSSNLDRFRLALAVGARLSNAGPVTGLGSTATVSLHGTASMRVDIDDWISVPNLVIITGGPDVNPRILSLVSQAQIIGPLIDGFAPLTRLSCSSENVGTTIVWDECGGSKEVIFAPGKYVITATFEQTNRRGDTALPGPTDQVSSAFSFFLNGPYTPVRINPADLDVPADYDDDGLVTGADLIAWLASPRDHNEDGSIDTDPYGTDASALALYVNSTEQLGEDCNANGFPDEYDIQVGAAMGGSNDIDLDGVPDECQLCPADVNNDGSASPADFTAWLGCFNDPMSAPYCDLADVNNSGTIDPADFTAWLAAFNDGCD